MRRRAGSPAALKMKTSARSRRHRLSRFGLAAVGALVVAALPVPVAAATTLYVDINNSSCSDSGPGSQAQPYCHIQAAAKVATAGTTVSVASGTYSEDVTPANSGASGSPITFMAAPSASVTITGQANGFTLSNVSWITVQRFTVTGTSRAGIYASGASNLVIAA